MGSPLSSLGAEIFMYSLEKTILEEQNNFKNNIIYWVRYVDDVLCCFNGTMEELSLFFQFINNLHQKINFTLECNEDGKYINFLDLTIELLDGQHNFKVFHKPTCTDILIPWNSAHCISHKRAAFNFYFDRLFNTPMKKEDFTTEYNWIMRVGINNGYPLSWLKKII